MAHFGHKMASGAAWRGVSWPRGFCTVAKGRGPIVQPGKWARFRCQKGEAQQLGLTLLGLFTCPENGLPFSAQKCSGKHRKSAPFSLNFVGRGEVEATQEASRTGGRATPGTFCEATPCRALLQDTQYMKYVAILRSKGLPVRATSTVEILRRDQNKCSTGAYTHPMEQKSRTFAKSKKRFTGGSPCSTLASRFMDVTGGLFGERKKKLGLNVLQMCMLRKHVMGCSATSNTCAFRTVCGKMRHVMV